MIGCGKKQPQVIKVGAILPLTGNMATFGQSFKNGIELAKDEVGSTPVGGEKTFKIEILYEDDKADAASSVSAFNKLINLNGVKYVIGGVMSSTAMPIAPIALEKKAIFLSPTATTPSLNQFKDHVYRMQPADNYDGSIMATFARTKLSIEKVAILYVNNDWGVGLQDVFEKEFVALGGHILAKESFPLESKDFRSQLTKIKSTKPEATYMLGYYTELSGILRQMRELNFNTRILSAYSFYDKRLLDLAGNIAEGAIVTISMYDPKSTSKTVSDFVGKYIQRFGSEPDMFAAHSYDCMILLINALKKAGDNPEEVNKILKETRDFQGVTGLTTFQDGNVIKEFRLLTVKSGNFVPLEN